MAKLEIPIAEEALRALKRTAAEMSASPEELAQSAVEQWVRENTKRSRRFVDAERVVDRRLKGEAP